MKKYLLFVGLVHVCVGLLSQNAWINELHYDDSGSDSDEVVEIIIEKPDDYDLSDFTVYLYNGNTGNSYNSELLSNFDVGSTDGNYALFYWYPSSIQNGAPDGLALSYQDTLITGQFLSYEGTFVGTAGPANGITSVDIGVSESGAPEGFSLQLSGTGNKYDDFTWQPPDSNSVGELNQEQVLLGAQNSNTSDIVVNAGWSEPENISYALYQTDSVLTTSNAIQLASFLLRDGGASADSDSLPTTLEYISFSIQYAENLSAIAVFEDSVNLLEILNPESIANFSNLSIQALDDSTNSFSVYASFREIVTDNAQLKFTVQGVTSDPSGSDFEVSDGGGPGTDTSGDKNKIEVLADRLVLSTPDTIYQGIDFEATVSACDTLLNIDLDELSSVTLDTVFGILDLESPSGLTQNLVDGSYLWTDLHYDTTGWFAIVARSASLIDALSDSMLSLQQQAPNLILSKLCDPRYNYATDRYIQIYNAGSQAVDLTNWKVVAFGNGSEIFTWNLSGQIKPGESKTCGDDENMSFTPDFPEADWSANNSSWNGGSNDGANLYFDTILIDQAEAHGNFGNKVSVRKTDVIYPQLAFNSGEWITISVDYAHEVPSIPDNHLCESPQFSITSSGSWSAVTQHYGPGASFTLTGSVTIDKTISNPAQAYNIVMASSASIAIGAGNALTINNDLIINSSSRSEFPITIAGDQNGNGSLIVRGAVPNQEISMERYIQSYSSDEDGWHLISPPLENMTITNSDFEPGTSDDLYQWDEPGNYWDNYKDGGWPGDQFEIGNGYLVAYDLDSIRAFSGSLYSSDLTLNDLSLSTGFGEGWHLLGNPFTSAIVWGYDEWELQNIENAAHVWNESSGNYSIITDGEPIPSTNGFFVKVTDADNSITIPESGRMHHDQNNYKFSPVKSAKETIQVRIQNQENSFWDRTLVGFTDSASVDYDPDQDVHKLFGNEKAPQLWTKINEEYFARNQIAYSLDPIAIQIFFNCGLSGEHELLITGMESFWGNSSIFLEDKIAGMVYDLNEINRFYFQADVDDAPDRFVLHFFGLTNYEQNQLRGQQPVRYQNGQLRMFLENVPSGQSVFELVNLSGQVVFKTSDLQPGLNVFQPALNIGIYLFRYIDQKTSYSGKISIN